MNWLAISFAAIAAWALLRVFGGERQRQVQDLETEVLNAARRKKAAASQPVS